MNMKKIEEEKIKEIIGIAQKLGWISKQADTLYLNHKEKTMRHPSYSVIQLSEVEKCMVAMVDPTQYEQMRQWELETITPKEN